MSELTEFTDQELVNALFSRHKDMMVILNTTKEPEYTEYRVWNTGDKKKNKIIVDDYSHKLQMDIDFMDL